MATGGKIKSMEMGHILVLVKIVPFYHNTAYFCKAGIGHFLAFSFTNTGSVATERTAAFFSGLFKNYG